MIQEQFNQMRRPREVKFRVKSLMFLISLLPLVLIAVGVFYFNRARSFDKNLEKVGTKVIGQVVDVQLRHTSKRDYYAVKYSYEYLTQKYTNSATSWHAFQPGQTVTVFIWNQNPAVSRADFEIENAKSMDSYLYVPLAFLLVTLVASTSLLGYSFNVAKKTLQYGEMASARIMKLYYGKVSGADVEYTVDGLNYKSRITYAPKGDKIGDMISIVYLREKPRKPVRYPSQAYEVLGLHTISDRV